MPNQTADKAAVALQPLKERFAGQTALIFASGPSLTKLWQPRRPIPFPSIAVNDAWHDPRPNKLGAILPDANILYATDARWWMHRKGAPGFKGVRVGYEGPGPKGVIWLQGSGKSGFDERLGYVRHGFNSGHAAVHLAAQLGAKRIVLIGYDMRQVGGANHYFGEHVREIQGRAQSLYPRWIELFAELAKELAARKVEVLNATPGSALRCFRFVDLEEICGREPSASSDQSFTIVETPSKRAFEPLA